ncbi:transposase [Streptomyces sp. NBC_01622]|uniref:transposase n=1 Tax=Streptomyces sp. NBC_01622 TaxID=2975903 RepID=UPI0038681E6F|nr:transposase [Streptomyces sp. NBC_01622]
MRQLAPQSSPGPLIGRPTGNQERTRSITGQPLGTPPPAVPLFAVVPRRWVVKRTFAWLGRCRRLSKDYEYLRVCSENAIYLSMAMLLVRRLASPAR